MIRSINGSTARGAALITALLAMVAGSVAGSMPASAGAATAGAGPAGAGPAAAKRYITIFVEEDPDTGLSITQVLFNGKTGSVKPSDATVYDLLIQLGHKPGSGGECAVSNGVMYCYP